MGKPSFEQLLEQNKGRIYRICKVYATQPLLPEDLFQEVVIQLWRAYARFEGRSAVETWVYRVTLNVCLRINKQKSSNKTVQLEAITFEPVSEPADVNAQDSLNALNTCIKSLDEMDRTIVVLSLEDLPYKEIAAITGLTENYIAVKMKRIRKKLLNCINKKVGKE